MILWNKTVSCDVAVLDQLRSSVSFLCQEHQQPLYGPFNAETLFVRHWEGYLTCI